MTDDLTAAISRTKTVIRRMATEATPRKRPSAAMRRDVLAKSNGCCARCEDDLSGGVEFDHIIPLWMKGPHSIRNLDALCLPCHEIKTAEDAADRAKVKRLVLADEGAERPSGFRQHPTMKRGVDGYVRPRARSQP